MIILNKTNRDVILKDIRGNIVSVKPNETVEVEDRKAETFKKLYGFSVVEQKVEVKKIKKKGK